MNEGRSPRCVILGGGSAGWITACLLHQAWADKGGTVTLVESPEIGIIGVGEGSTPQLKAFFDQLGIPEAEWMPPCEATYKLGIRFTGWSERQGFGSYFHPFPSPIDLHTEPAFVRNCAMARRGIDVEAHPDRWFLATRLANEARAPQPGPAFPFAPSYGYHFNAYKLGAFLRGWATARGVVHRSASVQRIEVAENGEVAALITDAGERIEGDIFVDCSGFRAVIMQGALGEPFIPFTQNLFNDRAVVMPTSHRSQVRPQTEAVAMRAGWRWTIPLTSRVGNGYVYSSAHISDEEAEAELRAAIGMQDEGQARFLRMRVGRTERSWRGNCLATGLSQGFIEPLEATALHIVIHTAAQFVQAYESGGFTAEHRDGFNRAIAARYEGIRDYIVAHYRMNQRSDTRYWSDNATNDALSAELKAIMTAWFTHGDMGQALDEVYGLGTAYNRASWHCLFAGYGAFPAPAKMQPPLAGTQPGTLAEIERILAASVLNFGTYDPLEANSHNTRRDANPAKTAVS